MSPLLGIVCATILNVVVLPIVLARGGQHESSELKVLQLVAMVSEEPSGTRTTQDWERGLEILPGARVAVQEVNRNTDILPGYQLELVEIITEGCSRNQALVQFVQDLTTNTDEEVDTERQIVGIIGPLCNEATDFIAGITGHPRVNLVQIAATLATISSGKSGSRSYLFQMLPLGQAYINSAFALMREFGWKRLAVLCILETVYDCRDLDGFVEQSTQRGFEVLYSIQVTQLSADITDILNGVRESGATIIHAVIAPSLASTLLCAAYEMNLRWPAYVWILPNTTIMGNLLCESENLTLEGLFLVEANVDESRDPGTQLVSGYNYSTFYSSYLRELRETANRTHRNLQSNFYASVFYDSVWAFALALNQSNLDLNYQSNFPYEGNGLPDNITAELLNLSFSGSSGCIEFDSNHDRKYIGAQVNQVFEGQLINVANYNPQSDKLTINFSFYGDSDLPSDKLKTVYEVSPYQFTVSFMVYCGTVTVFTSVMLFLYVLYRNEPEVKATSTTLSLLIFLGCYLRLAGSMMTILFAAVTIHGSAERILTCQLEVCFEAVGRTLMITTILMRLLRIHKVFTYFGHTGKLYSDKVLSSLVLCSVFGALCIVILWAAIDVHKRVDIMTYKGDGQPPYYEVRQVCRSQHTNVWGIISAVYVFVQVFIILILAFKTRKIPRANYRETKTLYSFLGIVFVMGSINFSFFVIYKGNLTVEHGLVVGTFTSVTFLCQLMLFLPKTMAPLLRHHLPKRLNDLDVRFRFPSERTTDNS